MLKLMYDVFERNLAKRLNLYLDYDMYEKRKHEIRLFAFSSKYLQLCKIKTHSKNNIIHWTAGFCSLFAEVGGVLTGLG